MKKPESNTKPAKQLAPDAFGSSIEAAFKKMMERASTNTEQEITPPTTEQLAALTAKLATSIEDDADALVAKAYEIWIAAGRKLEDCKEQDFLPQWESKRKFFDYQDTDKDGNISRDKFFKRLLPRRHSGRPHELATVAKAFLRCVLRERSNKEPTDEEVHDLYGKWNAGKQDNANELGWVFSSWYRGYVSEARRTAGKTSGAKKKADKAERERVKNEVAERGAGKAATKKKLKKKL